MNHLFQVTVYTGQQLIFEALQGWLQRPCVEADAQRQRRTSIRGLLVLLLKTAATGVVATLLDAAIEYRRRQLLSVADADGGTSTSNSSSSTGFGLGLSRAGITAWKARLLLAIDEMERQAQHFGIEPTHRFQPNQKLDAPIDPSNTRSMTKDRSYGAFEHIQGAEERQATLAATVEQLQQLVKLGGDEHNEEILNQKIDALLDTFIDDGPASLPAAHSGPHVVQAADHETRSTCHICMDRPRAVKVLGCNHDVCFQCARRLCAGEDHAVPQCPFCRRPIDGWALSSRANVTSP